ncbi:MAG TPA: EVE domain-containing protein [Steroidobacteraceae bacterium]|nr:EVE domain-containing protein [Steroidobacteraceae bacterium]
MNYWLFKSEPSTFGIDDLARAPDSTTAWDGVRNYQVRNLLRDTMRKGDRGFFYHSSCAEPGIVGVVRVVRTGYPEAAQFDRKHRYHDPKSNPAEPTWYSVDVRLERRIEPAITLETLRKHAHGALSGMLLLRRGNRLSITPVTRDEWRFILSLA